LCDGLSHALSWRCAYFETLPERMEMMMTRRKKEERKRERMK